LCSVTESIPVCSRAGDHAAIILR